MMEAQPNASRKSPLKPNKRPTSSSPIKGTPSTSSTSTTSTSKVLIITPEQIAKLGLTQQLNKVVQSQVSAKLPTTLSKSGTEPDVPKKRNVRVSKITIINPKSSEGGNCDPEKSFKNRARGASDTSVKSEVASLMKNKLSNLLKARETSSTSHIPTSSFNNSDIKSAKDDHHHGAKLEMLGRKRKGENLEISSSKIVKNLDDDDDDDVVLVDYPVDVKALPEEHSTKLKKEGSKSVAKSENQTVSVIVKNENRGQNVVGLSQIRTPTNPSEIKTNEIEVRRSKIKLAPNILSAKRVSVQLNAKSSVPAKENKINAEIQEPKEEPFEIPVNFTPHSCEDVKPKIHVLSNEQISLPHTYIESLKFKPDKSSVSHSTPLFISKSSNSSTSNISDVKPVINLVSKENNEKMKIHLKEELPDSEPSDGTIASKSHSLKHEEVLVISELPKTDNEKASVSKSATVNSETIINIENLNRHFIDKDTIILINDSHISNVFSDGENEEVAGNSKNSSHTNVENVIISESDNKPNLSVIDLTESAEDGELQKSSQNFPLMKSGCIKNFATQIKNKLEITDYSTVKKDLKNSSVKKLYSRKSSLSTNLTVVKQHSKENPESSTTEKSDLRANPERKSEISQSLKIEVPVKTEPSVKETYNKKRNLFTNVAINEHTKENPESSTTETSKNFSTSLELKSEISQSLKMEVPVKTKMSVKETYNRNRNLSTNVAVNEHTKENPESSTIEKSKCLSTDSELKSEISQSSKMVPIKTETSVKKPYSRKRSLSANLAVNEHSKQHSESSIAEKSKNLATNPESKSEIPQLLKMNIPAKTEPTVIKTYSRKRNLSTNLAINEKSKNLDTNSESKPEFPDLLKTKAAITSNNETNNAEVQNKEDGSITEHQIKAQEETIDIIKPENPESPRTEKSKNLDTNSESKPEFPYLLKTEASITSNNETNNAEVQNKEDSSIREHQIKAQEETIVIIKPAPKKRGRKKKSEMVKTETIEMVKTETIEIQNNLPEPEVETSRRGRKRKVVDYFALSEGFDSPDSTEYEANKPKRSTNLSLSESVDEKDEIVEIDTVISCNLNDNSINCTYSAQEISPLPKETPPKRKRGRPPRIKVIDNITSIQEKTSEIDSTSTKKTIENNPSEAEKTKDAHLTDTETSEIGPADVDKTSELSSTNIKKTNDNNTIDTQKTSEVSSSTNETSIIKKKKGRPKAKEPSLTKKIFNTLFDHINTSTTLESDKDEAPNETNVGNTELIANTSTIETIIVEPDLIDASVEPQSDKKQRKTKKRGRKRGNFKSVSIEKPSATSSDGSTVTCAVCDKGVTKSNWGNHKLRFHNNLAWKVGDPPLDLNDQKFVMSVLSDIYKRRKPLYCEKCGDSKKSVLGYLSHKSMCQKSTEQVTAMRVKCEFCDRSVLPVSMSAHLKFCKGNESENNVNCEGNNSQEIPEEFLVQGKRQAAKKAHSLIKSLKDDGTIETVEGKSKKTQRWYVNFDFQPTYFGTKRFRTEIIKNGTAKCRFAECRFETSDVDELSNHIYACDKKPTEGYTCKFCIKPFRTENDVLDHLKEEHTSTLKPDETSPYEDYSEGEDFDEDELLDEYNDDGDKIVNKNKPVMYNRANCEY